MLVAQVGNFVHQSELVPYWLEYALPWTLEQFATTPSTWDFYFPKAWFYTLSIVLSSINSSNSFNLLFILIGRMGLGLFNYTLIGLLWTSYDTLLHIGFLHFCVILYHLLQISLETFQIVVGFQVELVKLDIFLL
jgi:hypothetical protein